MLIRLLFASFISFPRAQYQGCHTSIVGAGPGGMYFAWRLAEADPSRASNICVFERSERVGGRIFTLRGLGPQKDLTVELGSYRFNDAPMVERWGDGYSEYVFTPLTAAIIKNAFKLPCGRYEPGNDNSTMLKIVDCAGHNAGFHTFVERMKLAAESHGVRIHTGTCLQSVIPLSSGHVQLRFEEGMQVNTSSVLLNLPTLPLLKVMQQSGTLIQRHGYPFVLQASQPVEAAKLYVYYTDAWWRNYLNLSSGDFSIGRSGMQEPPLLGRYHDGDVHCEGSICHGFLETSYVFSQEAHYFATHQLNADPPFSLINGSSPEGQFFLGQVHNSLYRYHEASLQAAGIAEKVRSISPLFGFLSFWDARSVGFGAGVHDYRKGAIPVQQLPILAMAPFDGTRIFIANEAFGVLRGKDGQLDKLGSWAECSLVMAENVLATKFRMKPPVWIDPELYAQHVKYPNSSEGVLLSV